MADRRIVVVTAGLGVPSSSRMLADQLGEAARQALETSGGSAAVSTFELREYAVDIANNMVAGYAPPELEALINEVVAADALVAVTPVFTASMSGLFKSFFDVIENTALEGKPVILGATGGSARHSLVLDFAMRPMFSYLRAKPTPTAVYAAPEDWGSAGAAGSGPAGTNALDARVRRAASELAALLGTEGTEGTSGAPGTPQPAQRPDPMASLPFEQLLAQTRRG
ncbi:NAD(P)H-dependent oxidoreductase [Arthrobacter sp. APC 3897]|uniref:CE1759 family FMN reductase n=1 Tax=Arthrobacter sp. APC 3897 TaxID=3035204 RepID=UPI0025B405D7|nr:CE1759 family FMN reductase [Arthrobacter sp. APC 3897]MDN3482581.1 NAD(P)H-dependent oxidoreductase [Arthrobacter sp. APC 3897]